MVILVAVLIAVCLVLGLAIVFFLVKNRNGTAGSALMLKADLTSLTDSVNQLKDGLTKQLSEQLGASSAQMQTQYQTSAKIIAEVTRKLTELDRTNKSVGDIAGELKILQNVLQNPKQRGVLGEYYLEQILKNILPPGAYQLQFRLGEGLIVDAVIRLDNKVLPIDSKFSLENYNRMISADTAERSILERQFKDDLKRRIDETTKYIKPSRGTLDQALMFIPSEAIYYDLLTNDVGAGGVSPRSLMQYALEKKVTIVGPSTLAVMLQTIVQGLRSIEIHKDTEKIRANIEELGKHLIAHNGYMQKLGNSLGTTVGHFNSTYKELGKIDRDIVKITDKSPVVEPQLLDRPNLEG